LLTLKIIHKYVNEVKFLNFKKQAKLKNGLHFLSNKLKKSTVFKINYASSKLADEQNNKSVGLSILYNY
jgi:hypothetical protein